MKVLSWNCQGLGTALIVRNLNDEIRKNNPSIIFLMETKIKLARIRKIRSKCGFIHDLYVEPKGLAGGLALWWHGGISLSVLYKSKNSIHTIIESASLKVPKYATFVYELPKERERRVV
ncbi:hypothetical protein QN277_006150 [Acacia crassicarpa]|uniref:Endonuclease/exonuclease/phosphatase domain-containing protein n=1 Tax=Acacia crassicarpa TaxID=499986 RepID=A0AAE1IXQ1_9FABA|nr:hypothetical protein QN277_006150 [Acacia crassicarpa]